MQQSPLKSSVPEPLKKLRAVSTPPCKGTPPVPILSQIKPVLAYLTHLLEINFKIIATSTSRSSQWSLSRTFLHPKHRTRLYFFCLRKEMLTRSINLYCSVLCLRKFQKKNVYWNVELTYGPGIESRWGARFSAPVQIGPEAHPASSTMGTASFPGVMCGRDMMLTPHPLLVPRSKIE